MPAHYSQQRILADRHHEPTCQAGCRPSAEREAEMMHDMIEPRRSPRPRRKHASAQAFREHAPTAQDSIAVETASKHHHVNWATGDWQISQMTAIARL